MTALLRLLATLAIIGGGFALAQEDGVPEPVDLPPPPPKDTPEPPAVPALPEPRASETTPTPAELGAVTGAEGRTDGAQGAGEPGRAGAEPAPWWRQPGVVERLGLTTEQAARLDRALEAYASSRASAAGELMDARRALLDRLGGTEDRDPMQALDTWTSAQHAMIDARTAFLRAVVDTLDGSQLETLARLAPGALVPGGRRPTAGAPAPIPEPR